jgi:hypothetical protein
MHIIDKWILLKGRFFNEGIGETASRDEDWHRKRE